MAEPILLLVALLLSHHPTSAEVLTGRVVRIADGDTLTLLVDKAQVKVRLECIDAPEKAQPCGTKAKQALSDLTFGKIVRLEAKSEDKYGRTLGRVSVGDVDHRNVPVAQCRGQRSPADACSAHGKWRECDR
jgi:endonuclease YncB( thermonuclease family)